MSYRAARVNAGHTLNIRKRDRFVEQQPMLARSGGNLRNVCQICDVLQVMSALGAGTVRTFGKSDLQEAFPVTVLMTSHCVPIH